MSYTVYKHTSPSGKVYIGITSRKPEERWLYGHGYNRNEHLKSAIQKYGWDNFAHEIITEGLTKKQACQMEIELIACYDSTNPKRGYNQSTGGEGGATGTKLSEETKHKMSDSHKGKIRNEEYRKHISEAKMGNKNPMYGVKGMFHSNSKLISAYDLDGNCVGTFACMREAMEKLNLPDGAFKNISACVHGRRKTAYGYAWRHIDDDSENKRIP